MQTVSMSSEDHASSPCAPEPAAVGPGAGLVQPVIAQCAANAAGLSPNAHRLQSVIARMSNRFDTSVSALADAIPQQLAGVDAIAQHCRALAALVSECVKALSGEAERWRGGEAGK